MSGQNDLNFSYTKIRQYVYSLIATSGDTPQRIPAARHLAEIFEVSHPTALRAIRELSEEGLLVTRRGSGTVTCPDKVANLVQKRIFGVVVENGMNSFDSFYSMRLGSCLALEVMKRGMDIVTQNLALSGDASKLGAFVRDRRLSGLLLVCPPKEIVEAARRLHVENGTPVILFRGQCDGISWADYDFANEWFRRLELIHREGRRRVLVIRSSGSELHAQCARSATERFCKEYGADACQFFELDGDRQENFDRLRELFGLGVKFDAVIGLRSIGPYCDFLREYLDVEEECRLFCLNLANPEAFGFTGYVIDLELEKAARTLAVNLLRQVEDPSGAPVIHEVIEAEFVFYRNGVPVSKES